MDCEMARSRHGQISHILRLFGTGETRKTIDKDARRLHRLALRERFSTLEKLRPGFLDVSGTLLYKGFVKRCKHSLGICSHIAARKSLINATNKGRRVSWSTRTLSWIAEDHQCRLPYSNECRFNLYYNESRLTHWGRDKIDAILQTTFSKTISWMTMFKFPLKFHWSLFLKVQLTIFQHWFR